MIVQAFFKVSFFTLFFILSIYVSWLWWLDTTDGRSRSIYIFISLYITKYAYTELFCF